MTPVPNCFTPVETIAFKLLKGSLASSMGAKTPIALVTSTTNNVPIRRGTSYSRSWVPHDFELLLLDSDSPAPTQCLMVSKRLKLTRDFTLTRHQRGNGS